MQPNADRTTEINVQTCDVTLWHLGQIDLRLKMPFDSCEMHLA